jgi:hypothetical protein
MLFFFFLVALACLVVLLLIYSVLHDLIVEVKRLESTTQAVWRTLDERLPAPAKLQMRE